MFYDKYGGARSEDTTTIRLAADVGAIAYSYCRVVIIGL